MNVTINNDILLKLSHSLSLHISQAVKDMLSSKAFKTLKTKSYAIFQTYYAIIAIILCMDTLKTRIKRLKTQHPFTT